MAVNKLPTADLRLEESEYPHTSQVVIISSLGRVAGNERRPPDLFHGLRISYRQRPSSSPSSSPSLHLYRPTQTCPFHSLLFFQLRCRFSCYW
ncbi:hypothetical protein ACLOJK_010345 [Asimina triloba]